MGEGGATGRDAPCVVWTTAVAGCLERRLVNQHDSLCTREAAGEMSIHSSACRYTRDLHVTWGGGPPLSLLNCISL